MAVRFRIDQATPGMGVTDQSRHDLVVGEIITLTAIEPAPGPGITFEWEILDCAGTNSALSAATGAVVTLPAQGTAPFEFMVELRALSGGSLVGAPARRVFGARSPLTNLRVPLFGETADPTSKLSSARVTASTDNGLYANRAGTGVSEANWRGWTEALYELVQAIETVAGSAGGGASPFETNTAILFIDGPSNSGDLYPSPQIERCTHLALEVFGTGGFLTGLPIPYDTPWNRGVMASCIATNVGTQSLEIRHHAASSLGSYGHILSTTAANFDLEPGDSAVLVYVHNQMSDIGLPATGHDGDGGWWIFPISSSGTGGGGSGDMVGPGTATAGSLAAFVDGTHLVEAGLGVTSGSLTLASGKTVDGRDVSVDGTKLDAVEAGAQVTSLARINAATGRSAVTDGTKLDSIESGAQVTSSARVLTALAAATGSISVNSRRITNLADPTGAQDAATRAFVIAQIGSVGAGDVAGPASATDGRVTVFDGTSGKAIMEGTKLEADLVVGPASVADGNLALFDGTTGKLIKDGGAPGGGLSTALDENFTAASAVSIVDGANTIAGKTWTGANIASGASSAAVDSTGLFIVNKNVSTSFDEASRSAPLVSILLSTLVPDFSSATHELRVYAELASNGNANYEAALIGLETVPATAGARNAWFYDVGFSSTFCGEANAVIGAAASYLSPLAADLLVCILRKANGAVHIYTKAKGALADADPNSSAFSTDLSTWTLRGTWQPSGTTLQAGSGTLVDGPGTLQLVFGSATQNTAAHQRSTLKRLRVMYRSS